MGNLLNVNDLSYKYKNDFIFENLSFSIGKKSINTFLGPNNCGKTTLIKILSGIIQCDYFYSFDNVSNNNNYNREYLSNINFFIPYKKIRNSKRTVLSFIKKWATVYGFNKRNIEKLMINNSINDLRKNRLINLSDFDFFKVVLNALLFKEPKIIFFDDVFDYVSYDDYNNMINYLKKIQKNNDISFVFTTTKLDRCLNSDKVFFISKGKIKFDGTVSRILEHDNVLAREGVVISPMLDLSLKLKFYDLCDTVEMNPRKMVDKLWE